MSLFICNADSEPENHTEAKCKSQMKSIQEELYNKEKSDSSFCLVSALEYRPRYVILFQDDAVPHEFFFSILEHTIHTSLKKT